MKKMFFFLLCCHNNFSVFLLSYGSTCTIFKAIDAFFLQIGYFVIWIVAKVSCLLLFYMSQQFK